MWVMATTASPAIKAAKVIMAPAIRRLERDVRPVREGAGRRAGPAQGPGGSTRVGAKARWITSRALVSAPTERACGGEARNVDVVCVKAIRARPERSCTHRSMEELTGRSESGRSLMSEPDNWSHVFSQAGRALPFRHSQTWDEAVTTAGSAGVDGLNAPSGRLYDARVVHHVALIAMRSARHPSFHLEHATCGGSHESGVLAA